MNRRRKTLFDPNTIVLLKHIGVGLLVLSIVALIVTGIWYGSRLESLTITAVNASGGETINAKEVEKLAETVLEGEYLGLIPRRFTWLYPEKEMLEKVSQVPRIHNVQILRDGGTALKITYSEYVPRALWCVVVDTEECVFIDTHAYAFAKAPELSGGTFLRFVITDREQMVGETMVDQDKFDSLLYLVDLLSEHDWFISHIELDQVGDAYLKVVGGGELKVTAADEPNTVVENFLVILSSDDFAHIKPGNFKYIDLRFGDKVYVNEELATPETEAASSTGEGSLSE